MKLLLTVFSAALFTSSALFAKDCDKKCDKKDEAKKDEATLVAEGKCKKKCDKEGEEKEATIIAHCGKCKKDGEHKEEGKEEKKEG
ncbi:MAG: hypothetical protein RL346_2140, partial [Verrucomicrobiota bacterium]